MKRLLSFALSICIWLGPAITAVAQLQNPTPPINLIIDSDMAVNPDDVGDHAVMWALANRGEVNVLALIASSANDYSAPAMRAIANYYGHSNVPVGAYKGSIPSGGAASSGYTAQVTNRFGTPGDTRANYPDAVTVYRQALASAADNSVYIVMGGFYQPMKALLQSPPDSISPLSGLEIVKAKVKRLIPGAGWFPSGASGNFMADPDGASYVIANWPGEIVSVGDQVCGDTSTAPAASSDPTLDPIKYAYTLYGSTTFAWTQCALLFAARGIGSSFSVGGYNGHTTVADPSQPQPGANSWTPTPNVGHSYILKQIAPADMAAIINPLLQSSSNLAILRSLSPASVFAGTPGPAVTINGSNFFQDSQVVINGSSRPTTYVSGTQLSVQLSDADSSQVGPVPITVLNAAEGNWTSNAINLTVAAATPSLTSISPSTAIAGSGPTTLTTTGSSFMNNSVIQVNGVARSTTYSGSTQLSTILTSTDLATAGSLSITVSTPGGGTSSALNFTVNNPAPALSVISPTSAIAGSSAFTLTVGGSNFVPGSVVQVNGAGRATTFGSATQLTATIPASDIAVAGNLSITIINPAPGGGTSPALTLTVNNPVPSISSVSPNPALAVASSYTLTVSGSGFVRGSVIQIDGASRTTTFVSSTQITAQVSGGILALGIHRVTVFNPTPGGGTSNSVNLTVVSLLGELMPASTESLMAALAPRPESFVSVAA